MTDTLVRPAKARPPRTSRRVGYVVAVALNAIGIYLVNKLLDWEWPSFLTQEFTSVEGWITFSFIVGILVNVLWLFSDPRWLKALGQLVQNVITVVVSIRVLQVFPFDFSEWSTNWSWAVRTMLIVAIVGGAIGAIVELTKLARAGATEY